MKVALNKEYVLSEDLYLICCDKTLPEGTKIKIAAFNSKKKKYEKITIRDLTNGGFHKVKMSKIKFCK